MEEFNLIVSTNRDYESQVKAELWFNLLSQGDENPIIFSSQIPGLVLVKTQCSPKDFIKHLQSIMVEHDPEYIQFIKKIYPIEEVVPTELHEIQKTALKLVENHPLCEKDTDFRISIRKRKTELKTNEIISAIADKLPFSVNLQEYDWNLQIEIIGSVTGLAILQKSDVFRPVRRRRQIIHQKE